jgi:hypothetical protein
MLSLAIKSHAFVSYTVDQDGSNGRLKYRLGLACFSAPSFEDAKIGSPRLVPVVPFFLLACAVGLSWLSL